MKRTIKQSNSESNPENCTQAKSMNFSIDIRGVLDVRLNRGDLVSQARDRRPEAGSWKKPSTLQSLISLGTTSLTSSTVRHALGM